MVGKRIKQWRINKQLTLSELSDRADVSKSYLSNIERGLQKNPSIHILEKIATVLNIDVNTLLQESIESKHRKKINQEWLPLIIEAEEAGMTKTDIKDLKTYIKFLKWRSRLDD